VEGIRRQPMFLMEQWTLLLLKSLKFNWRAIHVESVENKVALRQNFSVYFNFCLPTDIPPMFHIHLSKLSKAIHETTVPMKPVSPPSVRTQILKTEQKIIN
jgi:hypothetical protein